MMSMKTQAAENRSSAGLRAWTLLVCVVLLCLPGGTRAPCDFEFGESQEVGIFLTIPLVHIELVPSACFHRGIPPLRVGGEDIRCTITFAEDWVDARNVDVDSIRLNGTLARSLTYTPVYEDMVDGRYKTLKVGFNDYGLWSLTDHGTKRVLTLTADYECGHDVIVRTQVTIQNGAVLVDSLGKQDPHSIPPDG
jgi:hypothetical protein